ncbi:MAG: MFS transporter [Nocardioides sp.]|uniref:MFS transporter n=1 Tax=Nocardioides sp. TaxID=35761 RepID=UPI003EFCF41D
MSTTPSSPAREETIFSGPYITTTVGAFAMIVLVAFESMAVTTVMPEVARVLDGQALYATAFAAPFASGVVGMVIAGMWSDRRGPGAPLVTAFVVFSIGLAICALSNSMEVLVAGRILQGLGGGASTVVLYVLVGLIYPARLQPPVFALFAAAWVLPALFGPYLAALIADAFSWRWVFGGTVFVVAAAVAMLIPVVRRTEMEPVADPEPATGRLAWAVVAAVAVLGVELLADQPVLAVAAAAVTIGTLSQLLPGGSLLLRRGLPAVIATRGLLAASFFTAEAYIVYVLQEKWGMTAAAAGIALTCVGIVWALGSQAQARTKNVSDSAAMTIGSLVVLGGLTCIAVAVWLEPPSWVAIAMYVLAGAGMGYGYPRTGVAMLAASNDSDRGFNSSALSIADSLGAALGLSLAGLLFAASESGTDPFGVVYTFAAVVSVLTVLAATRTKVAATA